MYSYITIFNSRPVYLHYVEHWFDLVAKYGSTSAVASMSCTSGERYNVLLKAANRCLSGPFQTPYELCRQIMIVLVEAVMFGVHFDHELFGPSTTEISRECGKFRENIAAFEKELAINITNDDE